MDLPKIPRNPMRKEDEPGYESEIWQPSWKCFCCHDTGIITPRLARMVIEGYDYQRDKLPRCVNPECFSGSHWDGATKDCMDYRISPLTCQKLDLIERDSWKQAVADKSDRIRALSRKMSLRSASRSPVEEMEARRRHEEAVNADPEQLKAIATRYMGSEFMKYGAE